MHDKDIDITNEFGFLQTVDEEGHPVCSNCGACAEINRGQGTLCPQCVHDDIMESEHDHF